MHEIKTQKQILKDRDTSGNLSITVISIIEANC